MTAIDELSELLLETCRRADPNDTAFHEAALIHALAETIRANTSGIDTPVDIYVSCVGDHLSERIAELPPEDA